MNGITDEQLSAYRANVIDQIKRRISIGAVDVWTEGGSIMIGFGDLTAEIDSFEIDWHAENELAK